MTSPDAARRRPAAAVLAVEPGWAEALAALLRARRVAATAITLDGEPRDGEPPLRDEHVLVVDAAGLSPAQREAVAARQRLAQHTLALCPSDGSRPLRGVTAWLDAPEAPELAAAVRDPKGTRSPAAAAGASSDPASALTARERSVLALLARGTSNDAVAAELGMSPHTARTHVRNILRKLGVRSRFEAVMAAEDLLAATEGAAR